MTKSNVRLPFELTLEGKKILVTGHTGFTGSWACLWLQQINAKVTGFSLAPETTPALYHELGLDQNVESIIGDIRDFDLFQKIVQKVQPDLILHLAAQPLVRRSYHDPVSTFAVNALGTAHVLEAARLVPAVKGVVCITTDKVYQNNEWPWPYRENDRLGGKDPYSASKAAAEMVIGSYMASYGKTNGAGLAIATARGGNIIGGGDWSEDRLIPDFIRALVGQKKLTLRYPDAIRPWQHVLALVQGYLMLLAGLLERPAHCARAWNFGPLEAYSYSVRDVLKILSKNWEAPQIDYMDHPLPEAHTLTLESSLARNLLGWIPPWDTMRMIKETVAWYRGYYAQPESARSLTINQLEMWRHALRQRG